MISFYIQDVNATHNGMYRHLWLTRRNPLLFVPLLPSYHILMAFYNCYIKFLTTIEVEEAALKDSLVITLSSR